MVNEIDNSNEEELEMRLGELSMLIEEGQLYCAEEERKKEDRKE